MSLPPLCTSCCDCPQPAITYDPSAACGASLPYPLAPGFAVSNLCTTAAALNAAVASLPLPGPPVGPPPLPLGGTSFEVGSNVSNSSTCGDAGLPIPGVDYYADVSQMDPTKCVIGFASALMPGRSYKVCWQVIGNYDAQAGGPVTNPQTLATGNFTFTASTPTDTTTFAARSIPCDLATLLAGWAADTAGIGNLSFNFVTICDGSACP
jgi:hypothetical protein